MLRIIGLFLLLSFHVSCDPYYSVDYEIVNQTGLDLTIISSIKFSAEIDTNQISDGVSISLYGRGGLGSVTRGYLDEVEDLPFDTLFISTRDGRDYKLDALDISNWQKRYPGNSQDPGWVELVLNEFDF